MPKFTHAIGPLYTDNGSILSHMNAGLMLDERITACITVDANDHNLTLMKYGNYDAMKNYYDTTVGKLVASGFSDMASEWKLISFNVAYPEFNFTPNGYNFTIDEICTLLNSWINISLTTADILSMSIEDIKEKLASLAAMGY